MKKIEAFNLANSILTDMGIKPLPQKRIVKINLSNCPKRGNENDHEYRLTLMRYYFENIDNSNYRGAVEFAKKVMKLK